MPSLFVIQGNDQGTRFEISESPIGLGRDAGNQIQLHDTEVSRRHIEFLRDGKKITLRDLSSSNGTYVNGQKVTEHVLSSGDQVQVGKTLLLFTGAGDDSADSMDQYVDIVPRQVGGSSSRIIRAISQEEGSRIFQLGPEGSQSPWLARARSNLQIMYRTALAVSHTLDIDQLLNRIMELIFEWVEAHRGCIMLVNPETSKLEPKARRDRKGVRATEAMQLSQTILDYVMEHREGVLTSDAKEDTRWNPAASILQQGIHEAICVPMQGRYDVVGVIYIDTSTPPEHVIKQRATNKFTEEHLKLMIAIAHQAALAVEDTRYYSAMVQAERLAAVGQTIAMLSHHIKNILQGIRGGSYLIELGLSQHDEGTIRKGWDIVEKRQEKISNLVLDMLTFSKQREPEMVPADLNQVVADVVELMESRARELRVSLEWHPAAEMPTLTFDPEGMHRAVLNIVTNAIDACEEATDGRVEIRTEFHPVEGFAHVVVQDNGIGIPQDQIESIFSLFVSHKGSRGTGLGLPVSSKILREHGGQIAVQSQPGAGSRFTVQLPAVFPESNTTTPDHAPNRQG